MVYFCLYVDCFWPRKINQFKMKHENKKQKSLLSKIRFTAKNDCSSFLLCPCLVHHSRVFQSNVPYQALRHQDGFFLFKSFFSFLHLDFSVFISGHLWWICIYGFIHNKFSWWMKDLFFYHFCSEGVRIFAYFLFKWRIYFAIIFVCWLVFKSIRANFNSDLVFQNTFFSFLICSHFLCLLFEWFWFLFHFFKNLLIYFVVKCVCVFAGYKSLRSSNAFIYTKPNNKQNTC